MYLTHCFRTFCSKTKKLNYYTLLGVDKKASLSEIKSAYLEKAKKIHPDLNQGTAQDFQQLNEAYQTLKDENSRSLYDKTGLSMDEQSQSGYHAKHEFDEDEINEDDEMIKQFVKDQNDFYDANMTSTEVYPSLNISFERVAEFESQIKPYVLEYTQKKTCPKCNGDKKDPGVAQPVCENCMGQKYFELNDGKSTKL